MADKGLENSPGLLNAHRTHGALVEFGKLAFLISLNFNLRRVRVIKYFISILNRLLVIISPTHYLNRTMNLSEDSQ